MKRVSSKIMFLIISCCIFTAFLIGGFSLYQGSKFIKAEANSKLMYMSRSYANEFSQTFEKAESRVNSIHDTITATFDMDAFRKDPEYLSKYIEDFDPIMKSYVSDNDKAMLGLYITFNPYLTSSPHELWYEDLGLNGRFYKVSPATVKKYSLNYSENWAIYPNTPEFMDPGNKAMGYLYETMKKRKPLWFDPYKELGLDVTAISFVMPIIIDDTVIGVAGMDLNFETIKKQIREMPVYDKGYAFLMNESADILVHPDDRSKINLKDIDKERYSSLQSKILKSPYGSFSYSHKTENEIISYSKLSNGWILALVSPHQEVFKPVRELSFVIVLLTLVGIVISISAAYLFSRKVSSTMDRAAAQLRYIEIGDFTQEIPEELLKSDDDLGHFIKSVHTLQNVIRDLIKTIETKEADIFSDPLLLNSAVEKTQNASWNAALAIEQMSLDRVEKEENLRDTLRKLEEFNTKLQVIVKEEVQKNRQKDAVVIYQSRLAKMGEMIGNIAHQWRQPLNSLSIILSELKDSYYYGELNREYFEDSVSKSKQIIAKMSQTIDDFRNYLSPSKDEAPFSVGQSILFILDLMEESLRSSNIRVDTDLLPDAVVSGYENEFSQVISNILNNARDALEESDLPLKLVSVTVGKTDNLIEIKISNNGHPITSEVMSKLFTPYFTTKTLGKGTGIGLYMSKIIIEEHMGGTIRFQNMGHGVCCSIVLPAYERSDALSPSLPEEASGKEFKEVKDGSR